MRCAFNAVKSLYIQPNRLSDALDALSHQPLTVVSGGTDIYPARVGQPLDDDVLDISRIEGMRGIHETKEDYAIGATTTWTDIIDTKLPNWFDALKLAAGEVGDPQRDREQRLEDVVERGELGRAAPQGVVGKSAHGSEARPAYNLTSLARSRDPNGTSRMIAVYLRVGTRMRAWERCDKR